MNKGQEQFLNYILDRVKEGRAEEAKQLMLANFQKQQEGSFSQEDIAQFIPKMLELLKPEKVAEVQEVVKQFTANFIR